MLVRAADRASNKTLHNAHSISAEATAWRIAPCHRRSIRQVLPDGLRHALYIAPLLLATACAPVPVAVCPEPVPYSTEDQNKAADELCRLVGLEPGCTKEQMSQRPRSTLDRFMTDYGALRAALRACHAS